jgi:predicted phosphoadenosine phosphosulfate sulfurtransferase
MILRKQYNITVKEAAFQRLESVINNNRCVVSFSGGKESLVVLHIALSLVDCGKVPAENLEVLFIDEEAIFPCVERIVQHWAKECKKRRVKFTWVASEFRHFNCFNQLVNDESFITFDMSKKDVWIRQKPKGSITVKNARLWSYQQWNDINYRDRVAIIGLRSSESVQRKNAIRKGSTKRLVYPLHDWLLSDVWLYLYENKIEIPDAYVYMYKLGVPANRLRISQFFSIDTAASLVRLCEYYPDLFKKILRREPNAYLASLYWDTEMFRRAKTNKNTGCKDDDVDYAKQIENLIRTGDVGQNEIQAYRAIMLREGAKIAALPEKVRHSIMRDIFNALKAGDPKRRKFRAIYIKVILEYKAVAGIGHEGTAKRHSEANKKRKVS